MRTHHYVVPTVLVATAMGLFGMPSKAAADAISVGSAVVNTDKSGNRYITGSGTFSVDPNRMLKEVDMVVRTNQGMLVSTTIATIPNGTTQWSSNSNTVTSGAYQVSADLTTTLPDGSDQRVTHSMNVIPVTVP